MTRIAYLVTSAREMTLADGTPHPTGYFAEEALTPYERFEAAGWQPARKAIEYALVSYDWGRRSPRSTWCSPRPSMTCC
jgi:hypothetical protein